MTDDTCHVVAKESGGVLTLILNDSGTRNAIGWEMASALSSQLDRFESSSHLRVLLLTGRDPTFCSGADVRRMAESNETRTTNSALSEDPWMELQRVWDNETDVEREEMDEVRLLALRLHRLRKPSIAAINGAAIGLGMGLALGCDIRLASENATFSERFVNMGLIPADGSCWHLPRLIGLGNAYLMQYTGDIVTADEAFRMGLVSRVTMHEDLMGVSTQLAKQLAGGATYSMGIIKRLVQRSLETNLEESFDLAGSAQSLARKTTDHKEGVRAFLEKRRPKFRGR